MIPYLFNKGGTGPLNICSVWGWGFFPPGQDVSNIPIPQRNHTLQLCMLKITSTIISPCRAGSKPKEPSQSLRRHQRVQKTPLFPSSIFINWKHSQVVEPAHAGPCTSKAGWNLSWWQSKSSQGWLALLHSEHHLRFMVFSGLFKNLALGLLFLQETSSCPQRKTKSCF